jgi:hypothetical protein
MRYQNPAHVEPRVANNSGDRSIPDSSHRLPHQHGVGHHH